MAAIPIGTVVGSGVTASGLMAVDAAETGDLMSLTTNLGVFAAVVAVAYWFLRREERKDAERGKQDAETLSALRRELKEEREAHDKTQQLLVNTLMEMSHLQAKLEDKD